MNKIITFILSTTLIFSSSLHASEISAENNICKVDGETVFALFNGVMTSHQVARDNFA